MSRQRLVGSGGWSRCLLACAIIGVLLVPDRPAPEAVGTRPLYGAFGPEGTRLREQLWIVPGADPRVPLRATVFRPPPSELFPASWPSRKANEPRRPLVVINHGSDDLTREAVSMPVFYWLSKWFVDRGYVVLLPQRRGHGATGGAFIEGRDTCADPDHYAAGLAAADDIEAALSYMETQPFVDSSRTIVVGVSTGGWGALALAARNPRGVRVVVNFAGGRGGHAYGRPNTVCSPDRLIEAAAAFGRTSSVPTYWVYSSNDSYFGPELAQSMADAWKTRGGSVELRLLGPYGVEGHELVNDRAGWSLWGADLDNFISQTGGAAALQVSRVR